MTTKKSIAKENRPIVFWGALAFVFAYIFLIACFSWLDVWNNHYTKAGFVYVAYHIMRILFLLFLAASFFGTGYAIMSAFKITDSQKIAHLEVFLISSFLGAAVLSVFYFAAAVFKLNYTATAVILTSAGVFFAVSPLFRFAIDASHNLKTFFDRLGENKEGAEIFVISVLAVAIGIQFIYLFIAKGLLPDLLTQDTVGSYLPYYQDAISASGIGMSKYYYHFYATKGAGLFFLAAKLSDVQSVQLVSFYFFALGALVLAALVKRMSNNDYLWVLLAVAVFLSFPVFAAERGASLVEFQKPYIMLGAFIVFVCYLTALSCAADSPLWRQFLVAQTVIICAVIILKPLSFLLLGPYLLAQSFFLYALKRQKEFFRFALLPFFAACGVFLAILMGNYFFSGMAEASPLTFFFNNRNDLVLRRWLSPYALIFGGINDSGRLFFSWPQADFGLLAAYVRYILYDQAMLPALVYSILLIATLGMLTVGLGKKMIPAAILYNLFPSAAFIFLALLLSAFISKTGLEPYSFALDYFKNTVYMFCLIFMATLIPGVFKFKRKILLLLALVVFCTAFLEFYRSASASRINKYAFLSGKNSYQQIYESRWEGVKIGLETQQLIGKDKKIIALNFIPSFYSFPGSGFQRPEMCDYNRDMDYETVLFGSPQRAKDVLQSYGVNYVMVIFDRPLIFTAYAPIFEPQNMKKMFKVVATGENMALLSWRTQNEPPAEDNVIEAYKLAIEADFKTRRVMIYDKVKSIYEREKKNKERGEILKFSF